MCVSLGLKKPRDFTVSEGHGYPLVYLYNILGFVRLRWSSFPSIRPVIRRHPSRWRPPVLAFPWRLTLPPHLRPLVLAFPWRLTRRRIHPWPLFFGHARYVATLALGSRPRQGVARKAGSQKEGSPGVTTYSRESKEVRGSVREWALTLPRQLPFMERESRWTPETSEYELKSQISMDSCALYTVGKILKRRCLKWARIAHLDI